MVAMREGLIITAVGQDRPGIVERISGAIFQVGCNLEDSRMAILGGEFALVALVGGSVSRLEEVERVVRDLCAEIGLSAQFKPTRIGPARAEAEGRIPYKLTAVAMDQPGIVHKITHLLAEHGVNVATLETRLTYAPDSGTPIFALELLAQVPARLPVAQLRQALRELSDAENLDLELHAIS
jgi:glycine cleavage system transcriptional repressor